MRPRWQFPVGSAVAAQQAAEADGRGLPPIERLQPDTVCNRLTRGRSLAAIRWTAGIVEHADQIALLQMYAGQATDLRSKMHSITERTVATLLILAGWLVSSQAVVPIQIQVSLTLFAIVCAYVASTTVRANNRSYLRVAGVFERLSLAAGHFDATTPSGERIYPDAWRGIANEPEWRSSWRHMALIWLVAALLVATVWLRTPAV